MKVIRKHTKPKPYTSRLLAQVVDIHVTEEEEEFFEHLWTVTYRAERKKQKREEQQGTTQESQESDKDATRAET